MPDSALPSDRAVERLLDEYGSRIYGLGLRICGTPQDAEDMVQETFLQAFRKWEQFEGRSQPSTWLYTIASRVCARQHRKRAGEPQRLESIDELLPSPDRGIPDIPGAGLDSLDEQIRKETEEAVQRALTRLPDDFRVPLMLKEIFDFSIAEIADIVGVKAPTVKTRIHRGRLMLRRAISEVFPERDAPEPDHPRQVCLDLLRSKQDAMDRGVPFPLPPGELCARCQSLFQTLDLAHDTCSRLGQGELPDEVRRVVLDQCRADPL